MKNIIDFILESKGQRPRYRSTNKPYNVKNDELEHNKDIRQYKKDLQRFTNFFKEFNDNLDVKYRNNVHAFVFTGNDNDWFNINFSTDKFIDNNKKDFKSSIIQFNGSYKELTIDTIDDYDVLKNPNWMSLCSFKNKVETPSWHRYGYELEIKNEHAYYKGNVGEIYITKEGINYYEYHGTKIADLQLAFTLNTDNDNGWNPDNMIQSICNRANKKHKESSTVINLKNLGKGNLTGKNFAEAFNHVLDTW